MTHILPPTGAPLPLPPLRHEILSSDKDNFFKFFTAFFMILPILIWPILVFFAICSFIKMIFSVQEKVQLCLHESRDASGSVRCLPSLFVGLFLPVCARLRAPNPRRRGAFYTSQLFVFNGGFLGEGKRTSSCPMTLLLFITAVAQFRSIGLTDK